MRSAAARLIGSIALVAALAGCTASGPAARTAGVPALDPDGWTDTVYQKLTDTIAGAAGQGRTVVFDFDNTTQARDISEAVLARVQQTNAVDPTALSPAMYPPFSTAEGTRVAVSQGVSDYYDALLESGGEADSFREYSSLPMPASVFAGRSVADYLRETAAVYDNGSARADLGSGGQSTILGAGRPFIYPQMADLYGNLRRNGYDVWVVSAGIAWGVRWMVQNALNPAIVAKYGAAAAVPPDHVVAVTTLMKDRSTGRLVSDYQLTRGEPDARYLGLDPQRMSELEITGIPDGLTSWRGGKNGAIDNVITRGEVFLVAGDSMGDVEMLGRALNRLVVARLNKPVLAEGFAAEIAKAPEANWMVQPTINSAPAGFVSTRCALNERTARTPEVLAAADKSLSALTGTGRLGSFDDC